MKNEADTEQESKLVMFLAGAAFDYYIDTFTRDNCPTEDANDYGKVKDAIIERFSPKKPQAIVMKEAVKMRHQGGDVKAFIERADRCYRSANFNEESKLGLLREAVRSNPMLLQFAILRGARDYRAFKPACYEFAGNPKVLNAAGVSRPTQKSPRDERIDALCKQDETLTLFMTKQRTEP